MRRHEVGDEVLFLPQLPVALLIELHKPSILFDASLAHDAQHGGRSVFRGHLQLTADVVLAELAQEGLPVCAVQQQVVVSKSGAHEHLLHARHGAALPKQREIVLVARVEPTAGRRKEALLPAADAALQLVLAGWMTKVGCRPADVVDVALEVREPRQGPDLPEDGLVAPGLNDSSLMGMDGAKGTATEAPPVARDAELHLGKRRHPSQRVVLRVPPAQVRHVVDAVHLRLRQRQRGGKLDEGPLLVPLKERAAPQRVLLQRGEAKGLREIPPVPDDFAPRRKRHGVRWPLTAFGHIAGAPDVPNLPHRDTPLQRRRDLQ